MKEKLKYVANFASKMDKLHYMKKQYKRFLNQSLCLDIECAYWNGPISVIGIYKPGEGEMICHQFVKYQNLTKENLVSAFKNCKMLITYNGLKFDVPKIRKDLPGVLPEKVFVLDLYLLARELNLGASLKTVENTLNIERPAHLDNRRKIATKLWKSYTRFNNPQDLQMLLDYNRQDTVNLYPLAEALINKINVE